jgi:hypothetical protein
MRLHAQLVALCALATGLAGGSALAANIPVPSEKCNAAWEMATPDGDTLSKGADVPFVLDFTMVDSDKDATIDADEFNKACSAGKVKANEATVQNMK